ncbi:MAG TPA: ATP-binding protein [Anaeromyxobacter sp.]|nr:ATP-binding protein [Anaeromyxobacter sp.]
MRALRTQLSAAEDELRRALTRRPALPGEGRRRAVPRRSERGSERQALRHSEALYRGIARSIPGGGVCVVDGELRYLVAEGALLSEIGFSPERMEGRHVREVVPGEAGEKTIESFQRALAGETLTRESNWRGRALLTHYGPLRGPGVHAAVALALDITDRQRAEEALRASEERQVALRREAESAVRAKDEFLAMLGHELRNPLAPILTAVEVLRLRGEGAFAREQAIIERQAHHMIRLVDDLLDVARVARGQVKLMHRRLPLSGAVGRAVEMVSPLLEEKAHRLVLSVPGDLWVHGDEARLAQVFANLLSNAAKFTPGGGRIEVAARATGGKVAVVVRDDGAGIAPDLLPRVFDLFVQGDRRLDRAQGGLGLGLALARTLVQAHGGRVEARSEGPGRGSEFTVELPLCHPPQGEPTAAPPVPVLERGQARRVLVVDDNRDAADLLAEGLRLHGHEVRVAYDGPEALQAAEQLDPEVALLDIGLPVMNGYELARRLREAGRERCFLVAVTGYGQETDRARALECGFDHHVVKPVDLEAVRELVRQAQRHG